MLLAPHAHFAQSELTDTDLQRIRGIVKTEIKTEIAAAENRPSAALETEIASSETRIKEYVDTHFKTLDSKFAAMDQRFSDLAEYLTGTHTILDAIVASIVVGIGIPQIIIAFKSRGQTCTRTDRQEPRDERMPTPQQYAEMQKEQAETRAIIQQLREEFEHLKQGR